MTTALLPTYGRADLAFERGSGAWLYTADGRRYLDFASGVAVTGLGHAHPHLVKALTEQAQKVWHTSNIFRIPGQERLAERLAKATFADTVFFANSGAEAIECGLKMVRKYHDDTGHPERYRVITCTGAFHGRTLATISAGGQEKHLKGFAPEVEGFDHVAFGNLNELRAAIGPQTAADRNYEGGFATAMMLKDLKLAQEAAAKSGAATPLGSQAEAVYALFERLGFGGKDFSAVQQLLRGNLEGLR